MGTETSQVHNIWVFQGRFLPEILFSFPKRPAISFQQILRCIAPFNVSDIKLRKTDNLLFNKRLVPKTNSFSKLGENWTLVFVYMR